MRFQIHDARVSDHARYTIQLGESTIPVRNPPWSKQLKGRERMVFTWPGGGECTVTGLHSPGGAIEILSPSGRVWSGLPVDPQLRGKLPRQTIFWWRMENQTVACEASRVCCRGWFPIALALTLRESNGRRLATWFVHQRPRRGSLREDLSDDMQAVVLGMVLSSVYDFGPSTSD